MANKSTAQKAARKYQNEHGVPYMEALRAVGEAKQFARKCLFCGEPGVTKTHVFAKSFTDLFEEEGHEPLVRHDRTDPESGETRVVKRAKKFAFKPMAACQDCNGGWMRELEEALRPVLKGFAENRPMVLSPREQQRLALWAVVVALLQLELEPTELQFADSVAMGPLIYATREPPPGTQVWAGANTHGEMGSFGAHSLVATGGASSQPWGAALSFGHGNVHIVHHGMTDRRLVLQDRAHGLLSQIWPTSAGIRWPPETVVDERDLSPVAELIASNAVVRKL